MGDRKSTPKNLAASTLLGSFGPLTEEDREKLVEERRSCSLESILMAAYLDKDFARVLCEKVGAFAQGDTALANILKNALKNGRRGRTTTWTLALYEMLLMYYAHARDETGGNHSRTLNRVADDIHRLTSKVLSTSGLDNEITKAIDALRMAGLLDEILDRAPWIRAAIDARTERGQKTKAKKSSSDVPKKTRTSPALSASLPSRRRRSSK